MAVLKCGHPAECSERHADSPCAFGCRWCSEVAELRKGMEALRKNNESLRAQLDKKALHLEPGEHSFGKGPCVIGYLSMGSHSTLNLGGPNSDGWVECCTPGAKG